MNYEMDLVIYLFNLFPQVVKNAKKLCSGLQEAGYNIATGGTDVHLVLVDLRNTGLSGAKAEFVLEEMHIACNKNTGNSYFYAFS